MSPRSSARVAPTQDIRTLLRAQASVLSWFDDWSLDVPGDDDRVDIAMTTFLNEDCRRVPGPDGRQHWMLNDLVRRRTFRELGQKGLQQTLREAKIAPADGVQRALIRVIDPTSPRHEEGTHDSLTADLQVAQWLAGIFTSPSDVDVLQTELSRQEMIAPLRSFTANGFYGRVAELATLAQHMRDDHERPLVISGVGGIGKSTLLAKFVIDSIDGLSGLRFAYLNFDRGALAANRPSKLLAEILTQVGIQASSARTRYQWLIEDLSNQESIDLQAGSRSSQAGNRTVNTDLSQNLFREAAKFLESECKKGLLLVLDTFEEVQRQRLTNINVLWEFLRDLRQAVPKSRVIISGRALDAGLGFEAEILELTELDQAAAMHMVMQAPGANASEELAHRTIDLVSRNPLSLRLAIDILRTSDHDDPLLDLELQEGQIQGQLYRRILLHIEDPKVRQLAHPGLVVRVVTPSVIRHVLARPCGISVPDDETARYLFDDLEREATLVHSDGVSLRHRGDVRKLMLPSLQRDRKPTVLKIHRSAVRYYAAQKGAEARAEELYHRLMLEQSKRTLDKAWDQNALPSLLESIDEMPAGGQVYLWSQSHGEISLDEDITREADDQSWARATASTVAAELRAGRANVALDLVGQRRGPHGESLLPGPEVEALEALRMFDEALEVINTARATALRKKRSAKAVSLTLDMIRVLERMRRFEDAIREARELREALAAGHGESALDYLVVTTSYLRLLRRSGSEKSKEYTSAVADAVDKAEQLKRRELTSRPGLLRELLAEIGGASFRLLSFGIETVGVSRGRTDRLDSALNKVDESIDVPSTAEQAPVEPTSEATDEEVWDGGRDIPYETRGRTAEKVSKYAEQSGLDDNLSEAIKESYQVETDELYS